MAKELISHVEITGKVKEFAALLNEHYSDRELTIVVVLKGALFFAVDLMRELKIKCRIECISASSYGDGRESGSLTLSGSSMLDVENRHLLILDDIFETGKTMQSIVDEIKLKKPASIKTATLLIKKGKLTGPTPDWTLFTIGDEFVYGYGLDLMQNCRELKSIFIAQ